MQQMPFKGQKKVSISLDGPTIITRPQPISNASTLVWFAAFGALIGAICLGLVIGYSSSAVEQMQTISINRVWVPNENLNVTSSNESSEADDGASSETQGVETNSTDKTGHYQEEYFISSDDTQTASWVSSIITLGALFGAALAQTGSSLLGKKTALCVYGIPFAASWLLIAFAPNVICVLIGRFLTGFFGGIISGTTPSYVCEIATPALRGFLGSGFQLLITIGVLIACMLGNVFSWRLLAVLYAVPSFILAVMMKFMPESPSHIIFNEEVSEKTIAKARKSLSRLRSYDSTIDSELEQIIQAKAQTPNESFNFFKRLRHSDFLKPFIYSIFLMFLQQLSGINAIMFYVNQIFKTATPNVNLNLATFLFVGSQTVATFIESLIVDRFGRRLLLVLSGCGCSIGLGLIGLYYLLLDYIPEVAHQNAWLPLFSLVLYVISFSIGFAPIPWMMIPEMSPVESRGFISATATALNWGMAFLVTLTFPGLCAVFGKGFVFLGFLGFTALGTAFMLVCLPETSGKSFHDLRTRYAYGWKNSLFSATVPRRLSESVAASNLNLPANDQLRETTTTM